MRYRKQISIWIVWNHPYTMLHVHHHNGYVQPMMNKAHHPWPVTCNFVVFWFFFFFCYNMISWRCIPFLRSLNCNLSLSLSSSFVGMALLCFTFSFCCDIINVMVLIFCFNQGVGGHSLRKPRKCRKIHHLSSMTFMLNINELVVAEIEMKLEAEELT